MESGTESDLWLRRYCPGPPRATQLVFFPHAGGSASFYRPYCMALSDRFDTLAVQYPGRQDRRAEPSVTDLHALAESLFGQLRKIADRPIAFFGHSMGALLAFEVARHFEQRLDTSPVRLFVSGRRAPSRPRVEAWQSAGDLGLIAEIRELSGTDPRLLGDEEMLDMIMVPLRADYRAVERYRFTPEPSLRCPVTTLTGDTDPRTSYDEASSWRDHTTGDFDIQVFPGGHFFIKDNLDDISGLVTEQLSAVPHSG
ncbi:thioesterase [Streptomyces ipomoeae]|uniref:thioesterase II family protein n=1 Tax=Streptomyces ipomoeae TaxID=103232 RepID=UPI0011468389|nr:alpha/beta fold hydrolase [Streptomyces ipomoeae]MDX2938777.1 alpha/beta fold hydrolase [Streptomyces ipomoeae]TQE19691.1 thioesterase [Streptomyces ipomoeae]